MSITIVGSIGIDTIITPFDRAVDILGGSASYFGLAAANFTPVNLVAVAGEDLPADALAPLAARGVDLVGLERAPGQTFRWGGEYGLDFNTRTTLFTELGVLATFNPQVPAAYKDVDILFLANLQPTVQQQVITQVPNAKLRALDTMNFWISSVRAELAQAIRLVDIVFMAEDEVREFAGVGNLRQAARAVLELGPRYAVIKLGSYGALLIDRDGGYFAAPAFPLDDVRDPTGAGDAFAGGFLGYLGSLLAQGRTLDHADFKRALIHGNIMGAFTCEAFGVDRLARLTPADIAQRYQQFVAFTHVELHALAAK